MATTVVLLCAASTRSSRIGGFPAPEEPLDDSGRRSCAKGLQGRLRGLVAISPALAARESAAAMGIEGEIEPLLADIDLGRWAGRSFEEVHSAEAEAFGRWMADPASACPGGETLASVRERMGHWLGDLVDRDAPVVAITHPMVVRSALAHALDLPLRSALAIDLAPLSRAILSHNRHWRLQSIGPAG